MWVDESERPGYGKRKERRDVRGCGKCGSREEKSLGGLALYRCVPAVRLASREFSTSGARDRWGGVDCGLRCADDDSFLREATSTPFLAPLPPHKPSFPYPTPFPLPFFSLPSLSHTTATWSSFRPDTTPFRSSAADQVFCLSSTTAIAFSPPTRLRTLPHETHQRCATKIPPWTIWVLLHYNQPTSPHPTNASAASPTNPPPIPHLQQRCRKHIPTIFRSITLPASSPNYSPSYPPTTLSPPSSLSSPTTMGSFSATNPWPAILALVFSDLY